MQKGNSEPRLILLALRSFTAHFIFISGRASSPETLKEIMGCRTASFERIALAATSWHPGVPAQWSEGIPPMDIVWPQS